MDQVKAFFRFLRRQHFWLMIPVVLILMIVAWYSASKTAQQAFTKGAQDIETNFSKMSKVSSYADHPNEKFEVGMRELTLQRATDVAAAWKVQYEKQVGTMKWSSKLDPAMIKAVDGLRPPERVTEETKTEVVDWMLDSYRDYIIKAELKRLAEIIGSHWEISNDISMGGGYGAGYGAPAAPAGEGETTSATASEGGISRPTSGYGAGGGYGGYGGYGRGGGGGYGAGGGMDEESEFVIVQWNPANQQQIQASAFGWSVTGSGQPSVLQMLYSQEDVWVLDSLMQIIKNTNAGAQHSSQATIRTIEAIEFGSMVGAAKGKVADVLSATSAEEEGLISVAGSGGGYGGYDAYAAPASTEEGQSLSVDPADGRYVDAAYQPIDAETLRSNTESTDIALISVAKRMPVRMRLKMDSRKLSKFLAECANAPLTFEVHQVRLNPDPDGGAAGGLGGMTPVSVGYGPPTAAAAPGGGIGPPGGGGGYGGYGGYGGRGGSGYGGATGTEEEERPAESFEKTFEFFGIIYIYNPVDEAKLGLKTEEETTSSEADVTGLDVQRR